MQCKIYVHLHLKIQIADYYLTILYFFMLLVCLFGIALSMSSPLPASYPNGVSKQSIWNISMAGNLDLS